MFISDKPDNYEKVYQELIPKLAGANLGQNAAGLGIQAAGHSVPVTLFGRDYLVGPTGVTMADGSEAEMIPRIVLSYYMTHGGSGEPAGKPAPYRELPGGADFARSLSEIVDGRIVRYFSGRLDALKAACEAIGGRAESMGISCDAGYVFDALPKLPMMMTFYDVDEDFPAEAKVFYDITAPNFLDMECLAVMGLVLALELERADGEN